MRACGVLLQSPSLLAEEVWVGKFCYRLLGGQTCSPSISYHYHSSSSAVVVPCWTFQRTQPSKTMQTPQTSALAACAAAKIGRACGHLPVEHAFRCSLLLRGICDHVCHLRLFCSPPVEHVNVSQVLFKWSFLARVTVWAVKDRALASSGWCSDLAGPLAAFCSRRLAHAEIRGAVPHTLALASDLSLASEHRRSVDVA